MNCEQNSVITNRDSDLADCDSGRITRLAFLYRIMPRRFRPLHGLSPADAVRMLLWHGPGKFLCRLAVRFEKQATIFFLWRARVLQGKK